MTLNIATKDIENGQELWLYDEERGGKYLNGTTYTLGLLSISCGFNKIAPGNAREVWRRVQVMENHYGAMRSGPDGPVFFTGRDIKRHIGLTTNATTMSAAKFDKHMRELREKDAKVAARQAALKKEREKK